MRSVIQSHVKPRFESGSAQHPFISPEKTAGPWQRDILVKQTAGKTARATVRARLYGSVA